MSKIDKHIEELLHNHDCVIVPDFGGFITTKKPAYYNQFTSVFHPASKRILFNKHLVYNDGLLATQLAEKKSLTVEQATQSLLEFKDDCYLRLNEEGRVEIEKVGVLFFDKEKNIQFQQANTNFLKESFGLNTFSMPKIQEVAKKEKNLEKQVILPRVEEPKRDRVSIRPAAKTTKTRERKSSKLGSWIPMLLLPLMVAGFYVSSEKGYFDQQNLNFASVNPFSGTYVPHYTPRTGKSAFAVTVVENKISLKEASFPHIGKNVFEQIGEVNAQLLEIEEPIVENTVKEIPAAIDSTYNEVKVDLAPLDLKYHVIVGCFGVKENAENLVKDWSSKGYAASIVDKKGRLYRASVQSFATRTEAKSFLRDFKKTYKNSLWILKK